MPEKKYASDDLLIAIYLSFFIGAIFIITIITFYPININSIANQLCNQYNGYLISYKYNFFNSNFDQIICKINYEYINLIY